MDFALYHTRNKVFSLFPTTPDTVFVNSHSISPIHKISWLTPYDFFHNLYLNFVLQRVSMGITESLKQSSKVTDEEKIKAAVKGKPIKPYLACIKIEVLILV